MEDEYGCDNDWYHNFTVDAEGYAMGNGTEWFNTVSQQEIMENFTEGDTQSKILVEEEGLCSSYDHEGEIYGDHVILTPSQGIFPQYECTEQGQEQEKDIPVHSNVTCNLMDHGIDLTGVEQQSSNPSPKLDDRQTLHSTLLREYYPEVGQSYPEAVGIVEERFGMPSDVELPYGDESPYVFDPSLPCTGSSYGEAQEGTRKDNSDFPEA